LREQTGSILALDYKSQLQLLASNSTDTKIQIFSFWYKLLTAKKLAHNETINAICVLENDLIATGSEDTTIKIWKINNQSSLELVFILTEHKDKITALLLLKNNSLVSASWDSLIKVCNQKDENSFKCIATLDQSIEVSSLALYGSSLLISGHIDGMRCYIKAKQ